MSDSEVAAPAALNLTRTQWVLMGRMGMSPAVLSKGFYRPAGAIGWTEAKGKDHKAPKFPSVFTAAPARVDNLKSVHDLRLFMHQSPNSIFVCGHPTADIIATLKDGTTTAFARKSETFDPNAVSHLLRLDVDGMQADELFGDYDATELDRQGSGLVRDSRFLFAKLGLPWLQGVAVSVGCSSKAGQTKGLIRWHIFLWLSIPLTEPEKGVLVDLLNDELEELGLERPLDNEVGQPERLLFSAPARYYEHDGVNYKKVAALITNPFGFGEGSDVVLPTDVLERIKGRKPKAKASTPRSKRKGHGGFVTADTIPAMLDELKEGNRNPTILATTWAVISGSPRAKWAELKEVLRAELASRPAFDNDDGRAMLAAGTAPKSDYDRLWAEGARKFNAKNPEAAPIVLPARELAEVVLDRKQRNQAKRDARFEQAREALEAGIDHAERYKADTDESPVWTFNQDPAGTGKTTVTRSAFRSSELYHNRIGIWAPTHKLGEQWVSDLTKQFTPDAPDYACANIKAAGETFRASRKGRAHLHKLTKLLRSPEVTLRRNISCYERHERLAVDRGDAIKAARWAKKVRELKAALKTVAS